MIRKILRGLDETRESFSLLKYPMALDIETTSLRLSELDLEGISVCDGTYNLFINLIGNFDSGEIIQFLVKYFKENKGLVIMANASFDLTGLDKFGIDLSEHKVWDIITGDHLLDENLVGQHGLKDIAKRMLGVEVKEYRKAEEDMNRFNEYSLNDSLWTYQIYQIQKELIQKEGLLFLMEKVEMPYNHVLAQMRKTGVLVDWDLNNKLIDKAKNLITNTQLELHKIIGDKVYLTENLLGELIVSGGTDFNSNDQVARTITKLGIPLEEKTNSGKDKVDKHVLNKLKGKHLFIDKLLYYRKLSKLYNAFLKPLWEYREKDDRIRPNFINWGTVTGRLASSKINLQQLPNAKDNDEFQIRSQFIAPKGYKMIAVDYAGQELRVMALLSKDMNMINTLQAGNDLHQQTADAMGVDRATGKMFNFAIAYGKGSYAFAKDLGITEDEAQKLLDRFFLAYPDLARSIETTHKSVISKGEVVTPTSRKRRFKLSQSASKSEISRALRQSFNFLIQSLSADMIRIASNKVYKLGKKYPEWGLKQIMTVHDENVYIIKEEYLDIAIPKIILQFEGAIKSKLTFKADYGVGYDYQSAK